MRALLLVLILLVVSVTPTAMATEFCGPVPLGCVGEYHEQSSAAGCAGGYEDHFTGIYRGLINAGGGQSCSEGAESVYVGFNSGGFAAWWVYSEFDGDPRCDTYILLMNELTYLSCPAGPPPNPGWGYLLP